MSEEVGSDEGRVSGNEVRVVAQSSSQDVESSCLHVQAHQGQRIETAASPHLSLHQHECSAASTATQCIDAREDRLDTVV